MLLTPRGIAKGRAGGHEGQQLEAELCEIGRGQAGSAVIFGHQPEVAFLELNSRLLTKTCNRSGIHVSGLIRSCCLRVLNLHLKS